LLLSTQPHHSQRALAGLAGVKESVATLDESITPRLLNVERKSVKNVAELLTELIDSNGKVVGELSAIRKGLGAKPTAVTAGVVQFVTKCVPSGVCGSTHAEEINSIVAGDAFENVKGVYRCRGVFALRGVAVHVQGMPSANAHMSCMRADPSVFTLVSSQRHAAWRPCSCHGRPAC